jgi:colanic acid/amylovoran biosynthesis glycosyltransferase
MNLFVICNDYPFGIGEPYFENEMIVNENKFTKIYIIIPEYNIEGKTTQFYLPANAEVISLKISSGISKPKAFLKALTSRDFYSEIITILFTYKKSISISRLKTLVNYYAKSAVFIDNFISAVEGKINKGDILYTYWCTEYTYGITQLMDKFSVKAVTRMHGWDVYYERSINNYLPLRPAIFNKLNHAFTVSQNGTEYLLKKTSYIYKDKIKPAYLGTLPTYFIDTPKGKDLHIVSLSNIVEVKQLHKIAGALALIDDVHIIWTHIGGGQGFDIFINEVKNKLKEKTNIRFELIGAKHKTEVYELLENSGYHCLVNTSDYEGLPVSFMEALSFGIPIIAPNVGGIPEIVAHGINGFLTEIKPQSQAVANAIKQMANLNAEEYSAMRINAYKVWETKFNAEKNYAEFALQLSNL